MQTRIPSCFPKDADELMDPGSMTKIMTAYLVFKSRSRRKLSFDTVFSVSKDAVGRVSKVTNGTPYVFVTRKIRVC